MSKSAYRLVLAGLAVLVLAATAVITVQRVSPYVAAVLIIALAAAPFLISFERSRPDAREVVLMAVLTALAVASRAAFAFVPHFKPMAGVVMIAGIALGPRAGFLVGALAALASGFLFGQGPWTPFQMLAFGAAGAAAGLLGACGAFPRAGLSLGQRVGLAAGGFVFVVLVLGPILDTSTLFLMASSLTPASAAAVYLAGLPVNTVHGAATALTLLLAANPLLGQIARVRRKYGLE
ncbi:ECF transporter S component [Adlercreutzia caecimuris]|uniref:ECF transporter S component n=1 Tax=Adlercreutzia caecimuris TaxID=671266 RepID=A0A4S4G0T2_9ACTN|nr:ECF transporter S component [Adlercreutzia caecimuris]THG37039.1 ECF transporter S component [Adlercreutzia caecimuris]